MEHAEQVLRSCAGLCLCPEMEKQKQQTCFIPLLPMKSCNYSELLMRSEGGPGSEIEHTQAVRTVQRLSRSGWFLAGPAPLARSCNAFTSAGKPLMRKRESKGFQACHSGLGILSYVYIIPPKRAALDQFFSLAFNLFGALRFSCAPVNRHIARVARIGCDHGICRALSPPSAPMEAMCCNSATSREAPAGGVRAASGGSGGRKRERPRRRTPGPFETG